MNQNGSQFHTELTKLRQELRQADGFRVRLISEMHMVRITRDPLHHDIRGFLRELKLGLEGLC